MSGWLAYTLLTLLLLAWRGSSKTDGHDGTRRILLSIGRCSHEFTRVVDTIIMTIPEPASDDCYCYTSRARDILQACARHYSMFLYPSLRFHSLVRWGKGSILMLTIVVLPCTSTIIFTMEISLKFTNTVHLISSLYSSYSRNYLSPKI